MGDEAPRRWRSGLPKWLYLKAFLRAWPTATVVWVVLGLLSGHAFGRVLVPAVVLGAVYALVLTVIVVSVLRRRHGRRAG